LPHAPSSAPDQRTVPVLLVPGWSDRARRLRWLRGDLVRAGWPEDCVAVVEFRDRFGGNVEHAEEVGAALRALLARTGSDRVDVVAHSMGGLATRHFLHFCDGARHVRRVVFTGTPHTGTWVAYLAWGAGAGDMRPGSPFLSQLRSVPAVPPGVEALCLHTPTEMRVLPQRSALLADVRCQRVWCRSHAGMLRSRRVFAAIRAFLQE
jgi:triacylglycerol lipase